MTKQWSLILLPLAAQLTLAACTQTQSRQVVENDPAGSAYPARLPLTDISLPVDAAPLQPEGGAWRSDDEGLHFAVPGQADLFALACTRGTDGTPALRVTRGTRAEEGAKALFALIGNGRISRLPLDAVRAGEAGLWQGTIPATDERLDVLRGGNRIEATLPGGGTLMLPASGEPGRLLTACRGSAA